MHLLASLCFSGSESDQFFTLHCFHHHYLDAPRWRSQEILHILLLLRLLFASQFYCPNWSSYEVVNTSLILLSLLDGPTYDFHDICAVDFTNTPREDPQGPPQARHGHPNDPPRHPQGLPGDPKDSPRIPQDGNLIKFYVDLTDCHQIVSHSFFRLGSCAGVIYFHTHL